MTDSVPTAVLLRAHTAIEAQVVLALLRAEGITAFVNGAALVDEFAVSQRMMGLQGVVIEVRAEELERARQIVAEAKREGQSPDDAADAAPVAPAEPARVDSPRRIAPLLAVLGWGLALATMFRWVDDKQQLDRALASLGGRPWNTVMLRDGWRTEWRDTGRVATEYHDKIHNGMPEVTTRHVRAGWKREVAYDTNENGRSEKAEEFAADGRLIVTFVDADEDGIYETKTSPHPDGSTSIYLDSDQDGQSERFERHAPDGRLVVEQQDVDENGTWELETVHSPDGTTCVSRDLDQDGVFDRRELHDATGKLVLVQVNHGLQGFVDEKP